MTSICSAVQSPNAKPTVITQAPAEVRNSVAFNLLVTEDGKDVFAKSGGKIRSFSLVGQRSGPIFSIETFYKVTSQQVVFYTSLQKVPAGVAKRPAALVQIDSLWFSPSRRFVLLSAHNTMPGEAAPDSLYVVVVDIQRKDRSPLVVAELHQTTQWGLTPLAVRMAGQTVKWWVQAPAKGDSADLVEYRLDIATGKLVHSVVATTPDLRFTLYCPETRVAADFNSVAHYVCTWDRKHGVQSVDSPEGAGGFLVSPIGTIRPHGCFKWKERSAVSSRGRRLGVPRKPICARILRDRQPLADQEFEGKNPA